MAECPHVDHLLVVPRLRVQNANAVSSPLTHGFPSITAFLGLMWALERKTRAAGLDLQFNAVGVVCHDHQEQVAENGFVKVFRLTRNPVDSTGSTAAIVEEGRIHLDVSLVFGIQSQRLAAADASQAQSVAARVGDMVRQMRVAGGSVVPSSVSPHRQTPYVVALTGNEEGRSVEFDRAKLRLLPGFALVSRDDLLQQRFDALRETDPAASRLDAWLSLSRINWRYYDGRADPDAAQVAKPGWKHDRASLGWIVPIPVGYGALGELQAPGSVVNARDATTPFRFVESLYSIGQWSSPHRLLSPQQLLWYADSDRVDDGLYRCRNDYRPPQAHDIN